MGIGHSVVIPTVPIGNREEKVPVLNLADDNPALATLRDWIHKEYGRDAGLLKDDYNVVIDSDMTEDIRVGSGPTIMITVRFWPDTIMFKDVLKRVFRDYDLRRRFLRSKALVRLTDEDKFYSISESGFFKRPAKRDQLGSYTCRYVTQLEMTDKKSKRSVRVEIQGNAFRAREIAESLLYPESELESHKEAIRRARQIHKKDD